METLSTPKCWLAAIMATVAKLLVSFVILQGSEVKVPHLYFLRLNMLGTAPFNGFTAIFTLNIGVPDFHCLVGP